MTRINPCYGCPIRNGCERRDEFRTKAKGLGARSITFNCDKLDAALTPGTRVEILHPIIEDFSDYGSTVSKVPLPATILTSNGAMFSAVIDASDFSDYTDDPNEFDKFRFRRTMRHSRIIRFLDEPKRKICRYGNQILPTGECDRKDGNGDVCGCDGPAVVLAAE